MFDIISVLPAPRMLMSKSTLWSLLICYLFIPDFHYSLHRDTCIDGNHIVHKCKVVAFAMLKTFLFVATFFSAWVL